MENKYSFLYTIANTSFSKDNAVLTNFLKSISQCKVKIIDLGTKYTNV